MFEANIDNETQNGVQYTTKFIISEVIGEDGISKIGNSIIKNRTSSETINIINLASHRLYKETEKPIVEKGENIEYNISYKNNTEEVVNEFQLLDILPYNGDGRGTKYNGMYVLENIELTGQTGLKIYTTTDEAVKNITAKDENIGKSPMWKEVTAGHIGEEVKAIAVKGPVNGKNNVDIKLTLKPQGNASKDVYINNVTAQTNKASDVMTSTNIKVQVVSRAIKGKVWEDSNRNGVIDSTEKYLEGTTVKLLNNTNIEIARTTSNAQGEYEFTDLAKGTYKVEVEIDNLHELTEKEIGTNREINSKFNQSSRQTDEITKLNTISSPEIIEENDEKVEAGIVLSQDPEDGENVNKGSKVKLVVSKGSAIVKVEVPSLVGKNEQEAKALLAEADLKANIINDEDDSKNDGVVLRQSKEAGTQVQEGTTITITVNKVSQAKEATFTIDVKKITGGYDKDATGNNVGGNKSKTVDVIITVNGKEAYRQSNVDKNSTITAKVSGKGSQTVVVTLKDDKGENSRSTVFNFNTSSTYTFN